MRLYKTYIVTGLALGLLTLNGCVSREQADEKLAQACAAAASVFLEDGMEIKDIKSKTFGTPQDFGSGYREVKLSTLESDGWVDEDKNYKCVFIEDTGVFGSSYNAEIYLLDTGPQIFGKSGNEIHGSIQELSEINSAVSNVLK